MKRILLVGGCVVALSSSAQGGNAEPAPGKAAGPIRTAPTGHVSNYDESKVRPYVLPDPLRLQDGTRVTTAELWQSRRRAELIRLYETEIYGRVPARAPSSSVETVSREAGVEGGTATRIHVIIRFGPAQSGPAATVGTGAAGGGGATGSAKADVVLYLPARQKTPVPVLLQLVFARGLPGALPEPPLPPHLAKAQAAGRDITETGPVADILAQGYGYATFRYTDVQPDNAESNRHGVQALAYAAGQTAPKPDEWGAISAWAWAASRVLDHLGTLAEVDAKRVALIGHSRLGKTAMWASALDPRFALVFSSCSGEMGAALARRDFGETVDDMAATFPWWFAGNFQKYAGNWDRMPVDAHMLIALTAPRPLFITGGTEDQWADPRGEFLAAVAADPVYRLLGVPGLERTELPPLDTPLIEGRLGYLYHTGEHAILPIDWKAFLAFARRHL